VSVSALEQGVAPFDAAQGFIPDEVRAREVPLTVVDDAEQLSGSGPVEAAELRGATGVSIRAADDGVNEAAKYRPAGVSSAALLPCLKRRFDRGTP